MSKVAHQPDPVMLDEQSFEQFGSDQVAYKVWCSIDTAFELLGSSSPCCCRGRPEHRRDPVRDHQGALRPDGVGEAAVRLAPGRYR